MYLPEYENHEMNTDNYYHLIKIDEKYWNQFTINQRTDDNLLFNNYTLKKKN